ncbi:MAG: hypothetical protein HUK20_04140, partial [Fibrobacter sp.]|nr:hypothetical protein [Fibrobacter sp.]
MGLFRPSGNMIAKEFDVIAKTKNRKHDGFFKYVYTVPKNAQALLNTLSRHSGDVLKILSNVDLSTLEEIPERYHNVDEYGEADIAFRTKTVSGESFYFGILNICKRKS